MDIAIYNKTIQAMYTAKEKREREESYYIPFFTPQTRLKPLWL